MGYTRYVYNRINWVNRSDGLTTPLGKTNMNRMDEAIYQIAENLDVTYNEMAAGKFDEANAGKVIMGMPTWNPETGILTFQFYDGTEFSVDFNIEKIPVSFSMNSAGVITMTTEDGTEWTADIGDVVPDYTFQDSNRIVFTRTKNADGSYTVTADLKKNSITADYLQPDYLSDITAQASSATASAQLSSNFADDAAHEAKLAQSYSIGGSGVREGEDTDNARKYKEECQSIYNHLQQAGEVTGVKGEKETAYRHGNVNLTPEDIGALNSSGGSMTGDIRYKGTKATYDMIKFIDNTEDATGNGIAIGGGGLTIIGGGESAQIIADQYPGYREKMIIGNDYAIDFYVNCQNGMESAKQISMNADGSITASEFRGNASSATKAIQDEKGNNIAEQFSGKLDKNEVISFTIPAASSIDQTLDSGIYAVFYSFSNIYSYGLLMVGYNSKMYDCGINAVSVSGSNNVVTFSVAMTQTVSVKVSKLFSFF